MEKPEIMKSSDNNIAPRLIRMRDAPAYLGMDKNRFNSVVRPFLTDIPLGKQAIAFSNSNCNQSVKDAGQKLVPPV